VARHPGRGLRPMLCRIDGSSEASIIGLESSTRPAEAW
jgi:hypothetical protein